MRTLKPAMVGIDQHQRHRWAYCWRITRADDTKLRFTSHNEVITIAEEEDTAPTITISYEDYLPTNSLHARAQRELADLGDSHTEISGAIVSGGVTYDDLRTALYRNARVDRWLVDHRYPWAGYLKHDVFRFGGPIHDSRKWQVVLMGSAVEKLNYRYGRRITRDCPLMIGQTGCGVDMTTSDHKVTSDVSTVDSTNPRRSFTAPAGDFSQATGWFDGGIIEFTTGANAGYSRRINRYTSIASVRSFLMDMDFPFDPAATDDFIAYVGCDGTIQECHNKFNNRSRFQGFGDKVPGADRTKEVTFDQNDTP